MGTTVSQGVYFTLYSLLRGAATGDIPGVTLTVPQSLAVASLAGAGNVLLTNPIWVVATRMQAHRRAVRGGKTGDGDVIHPEVPPRASALSGRGGDFLIGGKTGPCSRHQRWKGMR